MDPRHGHGHGHSQGHDPEEDDDEESYGSGCSSCCGDGDEEEKNHFLDCCWSFLTYGDDAVDEVQGMEEGLAELDKHDLALWFSSAGGPVVDPKAWLRDISQRVEVNRKFLELLPSPEVCGIDLGPDAERLVSQIPPGHTVAGRNSSKACSTLRQFVRDWAKEGEAERAASYGPIINALERHMPAGRGAAPAVLVPGCGLGRLPFELARRGYAAQGNEFSYHMLLGSHLILNRCAAVDCHTIFPYVLSTAHRGGKNDHLRAVKIPDMCPRNALDELSELSMAAGEFIEVYKDQEAEWDAMATVFFLDTAKNVFLYIRTIAHIVRPGGLWINLGPLLYHYADIQDECSIEPSWEEVRADISRYFDIVEEERQVAQYTTNPSSTMGIRYNCIFFVAVRNSVKATGLSNPVF